MKQYEIKVNGSVVAIADDKSKKFIMGIVRDTLNAAYQGNKIPAIVIGEGK